jgi:predicted ABC-type ATPase
MSAAEANGLGWLQGKRLLERAISRRLEFAFETTLGGNTIPALLEEAADWGLAVRVWYVGLESPELHLARVRSRVAAGGHDIPEAKIRERYDQSRRNLIRLLPKLAELSMFDNSVDGNPEKGEAPHPFLVLSMRDGKITDRCPVRSVPSWAKATFVTALEQRP